MQPVKTMIEEAGPIAREPQDKPSVKSYFAGHLRD